MRPPAVSWVGGLAVAAAMSVAAGSFAMSFGSNGPIELSAQTSVVSPVDGVSAMAWGSNISGGVGDGSTATVRLSPVPVVGQGSGVKQVSSGFSHVLAVRTDGTAWAWGDNQTGELGNGLVEDHRGVPVQVALTNVTAVAAGGGFSLALRSDGTVWAWGDDTTGEVGDGVNSATPRPSPQQISGLTGVTQIAAGLDFGLALLSDGTVRAWGRNTAGELGIGSASPSFSGTPRPVSGLTGVTQISAGASHSLALRSDATVWAWGDNTNNELGDGTVATRYAPVAVPGLGGVTQVSAGWVHSLAVLSDGTVKDWGSNQNGELGDGTTSGRAVPTLVAGLTQVAAVSGGVFYSLALHLDGTVHAWGANDGGLLGIGTSDSHLSPVVVPGLTHVAQVSAGRFQSVARVAVPAFALNSDRTAGSVQAGQSTSAQVSLVPVNGFTGSAALANTTALPAGVTVTFDHASAGPGSPATVTFATTTSSPAGTFRVSITGTNTSVLEPVRTVTYDLTITPAPSFALGLSEPAGTVGEGGSISAGVNLVAVNGFDGVVSLTVQGLPAGVTASLSPAQVSFGSPATLTISAGADSPTGQFPVTIIGTTSDPAVGPGKPATYQLTITAVAGFSIAMALPSGTVSAGDSTAISVALTPAGGFTGSATLAVTGVPSGVTASLSPGTISASSPATLTLSTSVNSQPGTFIVTVTATNNTVGTPVRTATFSLTVEGLQPIS